jgi:hypothetical protein
VLDLGANSSNKNDDQLIIRLNDRLHEHKQEQLKLFTARWTVKGNLVLIEYHSVSQEQLTNTTPLIKSLYTDIYTVIITNSDDIQAQANVKWFKLLIHSIPTGVSID